MPTSLTQLFLSQQPCITDNYSNGSKSGSNTYNLPGPEWFFRNRSWTRTAGFRSYVKRKRIRTSMALLPMNPYDDSRRRTDQPAFAQVRYTPDTWYPQNYSVMWGPLWATSFQPNVNWNDSRFTDLYNKSVQKMPKLMNGEQFNLPLFLAESRKTIAMVANAAATINQAILDWRKKHRGRETHNMWLEYRYGWRLLLKDVYDALVVLHSIRTKMVKQRVTARSTLSAKGSSSWGNPLIGNPNNRISSQVSYDYDDTYECKITVLYEDQTSLGTLQQLGITNPALLLWELIPYSFVADWFIPVGNYLSTLDAFLGKTFKAGCVSYIYESKRVYRAARPTLDTDRYPRGRVDSWTTSPISQVNRFYRRVSLSTFPSQSLPSIQPNLNLARVTDAVALLLQQKPRLATAWRNRHIETE